MRIIVAGATGAIGVPLTQALRSTGHEVVGITRDQRSATRFADAWSSAIVADALDREALLSAASDIRADVVVHELTAIDGFPGKYRDLDQTNLLRTQGTRNLLALAQQVGATRVVTQSFFGGYGYRDHRDDLHGELITEEQPFGQPQGHPALDRIIGALQEAEQLTLTAPGIAGIVLRYGALYGGGSLELMVRMLRKRQLPVPVGGGGVLSFLSLPDAGTATAAAIEHGAPGQVYNVCDDKPQQWGALLDEAASVFNAPRPMRAPAWVFGLVAPYGRAFLTSSIPMSNTKFKADSGWRPADPTMQDGLAAASASESVSRPGQPR